MFLGTLSAAPVLPGHPELLFCFERAVVWYVHICVGAFRCVNLCLYARMKLSVFLAHSPAYGLKQGLSPSPEFAVWTSLASQFTPKTQSLPPVLG